MTELKYKAAVAEIGQSPYYQCIVQAVEKLSPFVPTYDYKGNTNIEEIKARLAQRDLHVLIMRVLRGE